MTRTSFIFIILIIGLSVSLILVVDWNNKDHKLNYYNSNNKINLDSLSSIDKNNTLYIIQLETGQYVNQTKDFTSTINNTINETGYVQVILSNGLSFKTKDNLKSGESISGTVGQLIPICDPNSVRFVYENQSQVNASQLEILTSNQYLFKEMPNPLCIKGQSSLQVLNYTLIK